jgi:hypothetical protein
MADADNFLSESISSILFFKHFLCDEISFFVKWREATTTSINTIAQPYCPRASEP